jgi:YVTN family beta-propeller protein
MPGHRYTSLIAAAILVLAIAGQARAQVHVTPAAGLPVQTSSLRTMRAGSNGLRLKHRSRAAAGVRAASGAAAAPTLGMLPSVRVGNTPQGSAFDPATDTVYVTNQEDNTVSVVDARHCNARDTSGCGQTPATVPTGSGTFSVAIDDATHTVYVANQGDNTLSVINAATCNGHESAGCGQPMATMTSGPAPFGIAVDPATDTIYVADTGGAANTVAVLNGATCNATDTSGCGQQPTTVTVGNFPTEILVDRRDSTVYVTNAADNTVSMIDWRTCNATKTSGCGATPPTVAVGSFPLPLALDERTGTLYVGSQNFANPNTEQAGTGATIAALDSRTCNALRTSGCAGHHPTLSLLGGTDGMSIDERTDTLFASDNGPGPSAAQSRAVSVINAATCNAQTAIGCGQNAPTALVGANPGGNATDPATDTEYVTTFDNTLQVINGATCRAGNVTGCGQPVPSTLAGPAPYAVADNPSTHTLYVGDSGGFEGLPWSISAIDTATCNTRQVSGCIPNPQDLTRPALPYALTVDPLTDTLYSSDLNLDTNGDFGDTVSAIDGATCNASIGSGCSASPPSLGVAGGADGSAEDLATHTLYVADNSATALSVFDTATCNATDTAGCDQTAATIPLTGFPLSVAVDQKTGTIYALEPGTPSTVAVINGAQCNGTDTTGCGDAPATITVGNADNLEGLAVDEATDTVYVVNTADDTVSVIDGATCNATNTMGCGQTPATVPVGHQNFGFVAVDQARDLVYVTNAFDDSVSVINGSTCNGTTTRSCADIQPAVPAGAQPSGIAIDTTDGTAYITDNGGAAVSFIKFTAPDRPSGINAVAGHGQAFLTWQRPYAGGLPIVYHVTTTPACPACTGLTTPTTSGVPATLVRGLARGQSYVFTVTATDVAGTSSPSAPSLLHP